MARRGHDHSIINDVSKSITIRYRAETYQRAASFNYNEAVVQSVAIDMERACDR